MPRFFYSYSILSTIKTSCTLHFLEWNRSPPLTSRRHRPVSFSSSPIVAVSFSPPVVKLYQGEASSSRTPQSSSQEATYVHAQFTAHEEHPSSRPTRLTLRPYRSTDFVQYLSQTNVKILAPPFAQHTPRESDIRFSDHQVFLHRYVSSHCALSSYEATKSPRHC